MTGRIVIIPFIEGKVGPDGRLVEPDINAILEKWLQRHPEFRGRKFHIIRTGGNETCLVRVTTDESPDLADYDPAEDADLYDEFVAKSEGSPAAEFHKIWIDQCKAARGIEDEFGTDKALKYLIEEKFIDFLEAAETDGAFRAEIPTFVDEIQTIFEPWQLRECLDKARQTEPFDPALYEPEEPLVPGVDYGDYERYEGEDPETIEMLRQDDIRHCTRDLQLMERAREWLLGEGK
ncbi:MAG: hypothetical protein WCJ35_10915 [Planctomycetota bacterium]